jgi:hypothetical protein
VSSNGESESRTSVAVELAGEEKFLTLVSPPVKSLIKRGFFGPLLLRLWLIAFLTRHVS